MGVLVVTVIKILRCLVKESRDDDVFGMGAELSFRFFMALFPFFIFLAAVGGFVARALPVDDPTQSAIDAIGDTLPEDARGVLSGQLEQVIEGQNPGLLTIGILGAIWAAAGGVKSMMKSMNRAYGVPEGRPFLRKNALSIAIVLLAGGLIVLAFTLMVGIGVWGREIADEVGLGAAFPHVLEWGRWPLVAVLLLAAMAFVYWAVPNIEMPFRWVSPGAIAFVVVWLAASYGFALYVGSFGQYQATYGALGGVVVLLLWFYLTSVALLLGAELNAVIEAVVRPAELQERRDRSEAQAALRRDGAELVPDGREPPASRESMQHAANTAPAGTVLGSTVAAVVLWRAAMRMAGRS